MRRMARKLRIEYPGATYHVMNRGDRQEMILRMTRIGNGSLKHWQRADELANMDWDEADLGRRRKGDVGKVRIARRLRRETTVSKRSIAKQLLMGW